MKGGELQACVMSFGELLAALGSMASTGIRNEIFDARSSAQCQLQYWLSTSPILKISTGFPALPVTKFTVYGTVDAPLS